MITLSKLDLVRKDSHATADELLALQTQLNALPVLQAAPTITVRDAATPLPTVSMEPSGYLELTVRGTVYVLPFYRKV